MKTGLLVLLYALSGRLGLLLAIPPGYATAVWPPSGIALAWLLVFGSRCWPGVFLGSILVNVGTSFDSSSGLAIVRSIAVACGIAAGASLQAVVGAWLVRRFVGYPTELKREGEVLRFLALAGPVASVVSATVGVTTLAAAGLASSSTFGFSWTTWWVGDAIGAMIFAPLLVIAAVAKPAERRRRLAVVGFPLAVTFSLSVLLFTYANGRETRRIQLEFDRRADALADSIRRGLDRQIELVQTLANFVSHATALETTRFASLARDPLSRHGGIGALAWSERIEASERAAFEEALAKEGAVPAIVWERGPGGEAVPAADRPELFPVRWVQPTEGNERARGFDVASDPARDEALERARESGLPAATAPITLVRDSGAPSAFLVFVPVYGGRDAGARTLRGFVAGAFHVRDLIERSLAGSDTRGIGLRAVDVTDAAKPRAFHGGLGDGEPMDGQARFEHRIEVGGRRWLLAFTPIPGTVAEQRSLQAWNLLATGLLFTGLAGAFLLVLTGRAGAVESIVAERTAELSHANAALAAEVQERRRIEAVLESSRGELQDFVDNMTTFNAKLDLDARFLLINRTALLASGVTPEEIRTLRLYEGPWFAFDPAVAARVKQAFERALTGVTVTYDELLKVADGRVLSIDFGVVPARGDDGKVAYVIAEARDITYQKGIERELEAKAAALERSNAELERFAYVASHDLQEPLRMVGSYTQLLERRYRGKLDADADEFIRYAMDGVARMQELIQDLLAYSRVSRSATELVPTACEAVLGEVLANLRVAIGESGAVVTHDPLPTVLADRSHLVQLFQNLIGNAIKFRGTEAPRVHVEAAPIPGGWAFAVADNGIGVEPVYAERIFVIFQRLHGREKYPGTGIGLAICKKIVERHGGRIWVERRAEGTGSVFRFTIATATGEPAHRAA